MPCYNLQFFLLVRRVVNTEPQRSGEYAACKLFALCVCSPHGLHIIWKYIE